MVNEERADKIVLHGLQFYGHHGLSDEEQQVGGRYLVDVELVCDLAPAGRSDDLADTVNYSAVHRLVLDVSQGRRFRLIEALAEAIAQAILAQFPVEEVLVRVKKQPPPLEGVVDWAGVEIRRQRVTHSSDRLSDSRSDGGTIGPTTSAGSGRGT